MFGWSRYRTVRIIWLVGDIGVQDVYLLEAVEQTAREEGTLPWIGASKAILSEAMEGHILAQGELVGKYKED